MISKFNIKGMNVKEYLVAGGYKGPTYVHYSKDCYDIYNGRPYKIEKVDFDREGSSKADIIFSDSENPLRARVLLGNLLRDRVLDKFVKIPKLL